MKMFNAVDKYIPVVAFFSTFFTTSDINSQSTAAAKFQTAANQLTGKILGLNFFANVPQYTPNISVNALNNPVTIAGATLAIIGAVGSHFKLPYMGRLKRVGVQVAIPSGIGAIIGNPTGAAAMTLAGPTGAAPPMPSSASSKAFAQPKV